MGWQPCLCFLGSIAAEGRGVIMTSLLLEAFLGVGVLLLAVFWVVCGGLGALNAVNVFCMRDAHHRWGSLGV